MALLDITLSIYILLNSFIGSYAASWNSFTKKSIWKSVILWGEAVRKHYVRNRSDARINTVVNMCPSASLCSRRVSRRENASIENNLNKIKPLLSISQTVT